jgi:hypothetical protein
VVVAAGVTDTLPVEPTLPIPVIEIDDALETFQLSVEDPTIRLGGVAVKELITGRPIIVYTATCVVAVTDPSALVAVKR